MLSPFSIVHNNNKPKYTRMARAIKMCLDVATSPVGLCRAAAGTISIYYICETFCVHSLNVHHLHSLAVARAHTHTHAHIRNSSALTLLWMQNKPSSASTSASAMNNSNRNAEAIEQQRPRRQVCKCFIRCTVRHQWSAYFTCSQNGNMLRRCAAAAVNVFAVAGYIRSRN